MGDEASADSIDFVMPEKRGGEGSIDFVKPMVEIKPLARRGGEGSIDFVKPMV